MIKKKISVYQQTQALLYKNFLKKWRMKKESLSEWTITLLLGLYFCIFSGLFRATHLPEQPPHVLGRVDEFNDSDLVVAYTPVTNMTQKIIDKMSSASFMKGRETIGVADKEMMDTVLLESHHEMVGIVFNDTFSYQLKLNWAYGLSVAEEHSEYSEHCWDMHDDIFCYVTRYWQNGFVAFQTAINAAIIELTTNHSVMETLTSVTGINMRMPSFVSKGEVINTWFIFICIVYFSPFVYSTSLNVTKERKKCKKLMAVMGLRESAFWLSWGLMYAGFVFILSIAMALIITLSKTVVIVGFLVIVTLFVLYGLSLIALAFLLSVLIKKPVLTSLVGFLFTTFWGCLGFTVLYRQLPSSLGWILSLFSPFAFTAGMAQISRMDYYLMGVTFPDPSGESHVMMVTFSILALDALLYLILMLYFERALPDEGGHPCSPLFFLKSSFWSQHRNTHHEVFEDEINPEHYPDDSFEPVPLEFHGKEAIRIRNIRKEYDGKPENVEALQGIFLDIYEGQVTAILGHNGAGKSTLLNILSGLSVPTKGSATIYNTQLSEITNMEETRMNIGFCPQFNIQFDFLTVRENLRLFAKIKGIQSKEVEQEVKRVIMELDIQNTQDVIAKKLTGGQKRKLTLGIALLGDPQVLLLDEPTTGLDPFSKHQVWNLLKERKTNRVILFSTQIMDEADILADRKVFLSNGKLKCAGSSLFLKQKWGIGYHLSLRRNEMCNLERITSLIKRHVPDAKLRAESEEKLVYLLPLERTNKFPDLYRDLEKCSNQGIMNYDVSMTTLNEVFLNLEGKSTIDEPDVGIWKQEKVNETRDAGTESEMQQAPCSLPGLRKAISTRTLWRRQVCAMARLRFLKLRHERKLLLSLLLLLGIPLIPTIFVKIAVALSHSTHCRELSSSMYFLSLEQPSQTPLTSLLVINNTGSNIEDFMQALKRQDILLEVDDFRNRNGSDDPSYNGAIIVSGDRKDYRFSVACNTKRMTCFPVLMGIVSNALLGIFNFTELIKTERSTFPFNGVLVEFGFVNGPLFLLVLANCLSPYIGMSSLSDRKQKTQSQLWISGLCPSAYWIGQALVDIPLYCSILLSVYLINCLTVLEVRFPLVLMFALVVCIVGCAASLIFFTYVISFIFCKRRKNNGLWCLGFLIISIFLLIIQSSAKPEDPSLILCMISIPFYTLIRFFILFMEVFYVYVRNSESVNDEIKEGNQSILLTILIPYLQSIIFLFVIRCLEMKYGQKTMRKDPVFRISSRSRENHPNPEEPEEEDENVQAERARTANALTTLNPDEKPLIVASCLHKEYKEKKEHCFSTRKKKIAIRNISFCVNKGEVLGLLGHNGAGKSTSIKMVTGDTKPTAGTVVLEGYRTSPRQPEDDTVKFLGYCPQENSLWPGLTGKDHLELYAAVKGMSKQEAALSTSRLVEAFKLQEQLKVPVKDLAQEVKRKLCFALSVLGDPSVVLLDEPSTGVDPEGQQQMWQAIQTIVKNTEKGVLLTTHSMAEAEAVCDRVAIMVSGKLRCIGSIQNLKSKFGKDYVLEVKIKDPTQVEPVHTEILKLFPQAARQERYSSMMAYKLPVEAVRPLSQAFFKLEAVKQTFDLEEYSLSQATLEQVFLELSKEQELGNLDDEVDTTVRWKLLPQEEP
ncbi:ATP-binding cassette sub-family A member 10 isoform X2 [Felis catus]|uniref:ABC transporter domain-containing protein n=2 Tax=Felis catus TaxID=9685 RepID=A0ABI7YN97_FELCA|nr:ATP-binding cassette sub-family A member 10 isoform X2 [Felis catus]